MQNCIPDNMREKTNLEDQYQEMRNIPPLLICNSNNDRERVNKRLLKKIVYKTIFKNRFSIELMSKKPFAAEIKEINFK